MRLLNAKQLAEKRAEEKHKLITEANQLLTKLNQKQPELTDLLSNLSKIRDELLTYLKSL